ncbi:MAG: hypothetical protein OEY19_11105 [Gammaproteobacteria bacterium]|nr:hypothetical protein [Gammaproteobacteria bacterium]
MIMHLNETKLTINRIFKAFIVFFFVISSYDCFAESKIEQKDDTQRIEQFNAWKNIYGDEYSYESVKMKTINSDEYYIFAQLDTHLAEVEFFVIVNYEQYSKLTYISSRLKRNVSCTTKKKVNLDFATVHTFKSIYKSLDRSFHSVHKRYLIVEKKEKGEVDLFTSDGESDSSLDTESDRMERQFYKRMMTMCSRFEVAES